MAYIFTKQFSGTHDDIIQFSGGKAVKLSDDSKEALIKSLDMVANTPGLDKINKAAAKLIDKLPEDEKSLIATADNDLDKKAVSIVKNKLDMDGDVSLSKEEAKVAAESLLAYAKLLDPVKDKDELTLVAKTAKELQPYSKAIPVISTAVAAVLVLAAAVGIAGGLEAKKYIKGTEAIADRDKSGLYTGHMRPSHFYEKGNVQKNNPDSKFGAAISKGIEKTLDKKFKSVLPKD